MCEIFPDLCFCLSLSRSALKSKLYRRQAQIFLRRFAARFHIEFWKKLAVSLTFIPPNSRQLSTGWTNTTADMHLCLQVNFNFVWWEFFLLFIFKFSFRLAERTAWKWKLLSGRIKRMIPLPPPFMVIGNGCGIFYTSIKLHSRFIRFMAFYGAINPRGPHYNRFMNKSFAALLFVVLVTFYWKHNVLKV